jgi:hypothetical protein
MLLRGGLPVEIGDFVGKTISREGVVPEISFLGRRRANCRRGGSLKALGYFVLFNPVTRSGDLDRERLVRLPVVVLAEEVLSPSHVGNCAGDALFVFIWIGHELHAALRLDQLHMLGNIGAQGLSDEFA